MSHEASQSRSYTTEGKQSRRVSLTSTMVKEQLSFAHIPVIGATGKIIKFAANSEQKRYVVFDAHRDAPVGFGVAINRTNTSYILQRRVGSRVMKATIGNCRDIPLAKAMENAKTALEAMRTTGRTPAEARERELFLDQGATTWELGNELFAGLISRMKRSAASHQSKSKAFPKRIAVDLNGPCEGQQPSHVAMRLDPAKFGAYEEAGV